MTRTSEPLHDIQAEVFSTLPRAATLIREFIVAEFIPRTYLLHEKDRIVAIKAYGHPSRLVKMSRETSICTEYALRGHWKSFSTLFVTVELT